MDLAASIWKRSEQGPAGTPSKQAVWKSQLAAEAKRPRGRLGTWRGGDDKCYLGVSAAFPIEPLLMLYPLWVRPSNKYRWLPGFTALHSTELGSNPRAVSFMLRDPELLALCLSSCPRQRVFRPVSPVPMPASHGELESQEWVSQRLTQQASPGARPGCPAGIFHAARVGLKASMQPPATTQEGVTLWSQPWGQNLSKTQNLHSIEWHRAEER